MQSPTPTHKPTSVEHAKLWVGRNKNDLSKQKAYKMFVWRKANVLVPSEIIIHIKIG